MKENDETAELFNEHFVSIGEKLAKEIDPVDISPTQQVKQAESKFKFRMISSIEVFDMLKKCKINWTSEKYHLLIFSMIQIPPFNGTSIVRL